jgi:hypothetical protein
LTVADLRGRKRRQVAVRALIIFISLFLSTIIAEISNLLPSNYYMYIPSGLFITIALLAAYLVFFDRIEKFFWRISYKRKFKRPYIGILKEERCKPAFTRFTPEDWRNRFHTKYKVKLISIDEIKNGFTVIINPYGEVYLEKDVMTFKTLERIKKYIAEGGIFVNAGGLAFFYGFDGKRNFPTGKEIQIYQGRLITPTNMLIQPAFAYPLQWSLLDTLLRQHFSVATTMGKEVLAQAYQDKEDRKYIGDIEDIGGTRFIMEFRAVREPTPKCIPFLRVKTGFGIVYPIAAIPYGKGYLFLCGMHLDTKLTVMGVDLDKSEFEKASVAIENFIEAIKKGYVKSK